MLSQIGTFQFPVRDTPGAPLQYHKPDSPTTNPLDPAHRRDTVQVYKALAEAGLEYGPAFRLLRNVHVPLSHA